MTRLIPLLVVVSLFHYSCKTDPSEKTNSDTKNIKDTILKQYFTMVDTLSYYDTNTNEFKLLRAYYLNDTSTLKELQAHLENLNTELEWEINWDSCVEQQEFKDIQADEKYRFVYKAALCPYITSLTIIKNKDSIALNTLVYQYAWDTVPCQIEDEYITTVDSLDWEKFRNSLEVADFWGLKPDNGRRGLDGSTLEVYGFKKGIYKWHPDQSNFISRWSAGYASITDSYVLLLLLSKTKKGCWTVSQKK